MITMEKLYSGNSRYMATVERYGREDIADQVNNHMILAEIPTIGNRHIIITEKFLICSDLFVLSFDDIELFDMMRLLRYGQQSIIACDNKGECYSARLYITEDKVRKITSLVSSRSSSIMIGCTPEHQLEYKRRHSEEFTAIARERMTGNTLYRYDMKYLTSDTFIWFIIAMAVCGSLMLLRVFTEAETALQAGSMIFVATFFFAMAGMGIRRCIIIARGYKAFCRANEDDLLDQINNRVVYTPNTMRRRAVFVTEKYLFFVGKCVIRREDVLWFHSYTYKSKRCFHAGDKDGKQYEVSVAAENHDWENEEVLIGTLLPNAIVGDSDDIRSYYKTHTR